VSGRKRQKSIMLIQWNKAARVPLFLPREGYRVSFVKINSSPRPPSLGKKRRGSRRKRQKSITLI